VTSHNIWSRYRRHFVGITCITHKTLCVTLKGEDLPCYSNEIESVDENVRVIFDLLKSVFRPQQSQTFLRVLPTTRRRKPAGIDTKRIYVTVTLCVVYGCDWVIVPRGSSKKNEVNWKPMRFV